MSGLKCVSCYYGVNVRRGVFTKLKNDCKILYNGFGNHNLNNSIHNLQISKTKHGNLSNYSSSAYVIKKNDNNPALFKRTKKITHDLTHGPDLKDFIKSSNSNLETIEAENIPYLKPAFGNNRKVYFDVYGCQMNVNDTEIIWSILQKTGFQKTDIITEADVILVVTCAIRDGAETKIWNRLDYLKSLKRTRSYHQKSKPPLKVGLLGCMAERLKHKLLETDKMVDLIAGPDSYKDLPRLLAITDNDDTAINVILSYDETYADVMPVRLNQDSVSAFVSIMRGCDNMCTYCIVPFTRGRERSRPISSIIDEVSHLSDQGVKEITLLGQNVNSYRDLSESKVSMEDKKSTSMAKGFKTVYKSKIGGLRFSDLLDKVSLINPEMRIRFTSPHPKDFPDEVLQLIAERPNICRHIHLPAQSGNSAVLERMRRGYTREAYIELVERIREILPDVCLSSDFICGFCDETEEEFQDTISLLKLVKYNMTYLFAYSMREKTTAHRRYQDNVEESIKQNRLRRMMNVYRSEVERVNLSQIGQHHLVLIEGKSRRSEYNLQGRNSGNTRVIIPAGAIQDDESPMQTRNVKAGDYVVVQILNGSSQVLKGIPLYHSSITQHALNTRRQNERMYDSL